MEGIDDPLDFKAGELQTLDENLRCPICKEFYDTAMILSTCSHSFCAICIRRSLAAEQCCPKCRTPSHDSKLHNNYDLDNVIHAWKLSRKIILDLEQTTSIQTEQSTTAIEQATIRTTTTTTTTNDSPLLPPPRLPSSSSSTSADAPNHKSNFTEQFQDTSSSRRSTRLQSVTSLSENPDLVTCPICQQKMHMEVLNQHVDNCLNGDSTIPPRPTKPVIPQLVEKPINTGKKPIKIVYDMYKEKDLRRLLRDLDLPNHGDKSQMVWRYKEYVTMYNANMDSPDPMDITKLMRQLHKAESLQFSAKMASKRSAPDVDEHNILFYFIIFL
ncbi:hypothetical protein BCR42DRAFT_414074 [Absidia repens]|uniref:Postreplication repair E3 ubiquitin-protein ligase RAD18 n=1 Tax=Absidia repens TaxID=90262 RepID=A0A1X2IID3_9FUNG|nr:hypothetical protein BCR42DRAFT_414074 [Absidia repens]